MKVQVDPKTKGYMRPTDHGKVLSVALTEEGAKQRPDGWQQIVRVKEWGTIHAIENPKTKLHSFSAKGKATVQMLRLKDDKLFPKKECDFMIEAEESFDDIGLPDIKVSKLDLNK
jgi:hypothetical protein